MRADDDDDDDDDDVLHYPPHTLAHSFLLGSAVINTSRRWSALARRLGSHPEAWGGLRKLSKTDSSKRPVYTAAEREGREGGERARESER